MVDATVARGALLPPVINSLHPRPIQWAHIIGLFEEVLKSRPGGDQAFSIVSFREWNERVAHAASLVKGPKRNGQKRFPSTKIQHVIDSIMCWNEALHNTENGTNGEAYTGTAKFEVHEATRLSETLRNAPRLGKEHVEKWVSYWEKKGLFTSCSLDNSASAPLLHGTGSVVRARL
ncbi:hypothetical protein BDV93DRAFT_496000 [Ceratobasidium sp. AG-I]|nr:hypothetical protein BDV93DRAFT_496000 [Ceratobasidium sp. AG-I]